MNQNGHGWEPVPPPEKKDTRENRAGSPEDCFVMMETARLRICVLSDEEMVRFIWTQTDEELIKAYKEMLQGSVEHPEQRVWYAIWSIERKDGTSVGDLCFKGPPENGAVEIGYGILPEHMGNGYATEAVGAAVKWALRQTGVLCVEAETGPDNRASQRVLEKCGFVSNGAYGEEGPRFARAAEQKRKMIV